MRRGDPQFGSDWTPGESRTFHLDELPEGCEVNVVSSDRELMTADYADNAIIPHSCGKRTCHCDGGAFDERLQPLQEL